MTLKKVFLKIIIRKIKQFEIGVRKIVKNVCVCRQIGKI